MESDYEDALLTLQEENLLLKQQICALEHLLANGYVRTSIDIITFLCII